MTRLAAMLLGTPFASVTIVSEPASSERTWVDARTAADRQFLVEPALRQHVIESGELLVIDDTWRNLPAKTGRPSVSQSAVSWAGIPVRGQDGYVVGALCVADRLPRHWSDHDVEVLVSLALVASGEAALQLALEHACGEDGLAADRSPPRIPKIPGLQVAARCMPGRAGPGFARIFYDVFPSVGDRWGLVVCEVSGQILSVPRSTALARYTLRAQAHKAGRPSTVLAGLNHAVLRWPATDRRLLTAIYATIRPCMAGVIVQVCCAGRTGALVRRADGATQTAGRPGTPLGLRPDPELHDSRRLLRAGDSLFLVSDSVTEACAPAGRDRFGDDRLRQVVADLGAVSAPRGADTVLRAALAFGGGQIGDDSVALVLKVPGNKPGPGAHAAAWPGTRAYPKAGGHAAGRSQSLRRAL